MSEKIEVGVWIDHQKAVVVIRENGEEAIFELESNTERRIRNARTPHKLEPNFSTMSSAEDMRDRAFLNKLSSFYDEVISLVRYADQIFIFGPGEAKLELKKRIEKKRLCGLVACVEGAGKLTNYQIGAKVREFFLGENSDQPED